MRRVLLVLLIVSTAFAAGLNIEIRDFSTNELMPDSTVSVDALNTQSNESTQFTKRVENGNASIELEPGPWKVAVKVDDPSTPGKDYYAETQINLQQTMGITLFLEPVGSIRGTVNDEGDQILPGTKVKFECIGSYGEIEEVETDEFGGFSADWLPSGSCRVSGRFDLAIGTQTVNIKKGEVEEVKLQLASQAVNPLLLHPLRYLALALIIGTAFGMFVLYYFYKKRKNRKAEKRAEPIIIFKKEKTDVLKDILKTFNERERQVVELLLEKDQETTQAKVYKTTRIPRTSLSRCLQSLEKKNVITIRKFGKVKRIKLTDWFRKKKLK